MLMECASGLVQTGMWEVILNGCKRTYRILGKPRFFADRIFAIEQGEVQGWNRPVAGKISKDPQFQQVSIGIAPLRVAA